MQEDVGTSSKKRGDNLKDNRKNARLRFRLESRVLRNFKQYCCDKGISMSESIRQLIEKEMNGEI